MMQHAPPPYEIKALGGARSLAEIMLAQHTQPKTWQSKNYNMRSQIMAGHSMVKLSGGVTHIDRYLLFGGVFGTGSYMLSSLGWRGCGR